MCLSRVSHLAYLLDVLDLAHVFHEAHSHLLWYSVCFDVLGLRDVLDPLDVLDLRHALASGVAPFSVWLISSEKVVISVEKVAISSEKWLFPQKKMLIPPGKKLQPICPPRARKG